MGEEGTEIKKRAVVLLSGGLDSTTTAYWAREEGFEIYALTFLYDQRHEKEIEGAKTIAKLLDVREHILLKIPLEDIGRSSLFKKGEDIPDGGDEIGLNVPSTYVPARNIILLSFAVSYAESIDAQAVFIGANAVDYSGYPDCRPEFYEAYQKACDLGTKRGAEGDPITIRYPLIHLSKAEIISKALSLGAPLEHTWSCYRGGKDACGTCESCRLRLKGFKETGKIDPVKYASNR